jgi:acyl-CoA carboxylase subunit beta
VLTGDGLIGGQRVALIASEFGFLGGSIGRDAARRLVSAIERATGEGLPLLAGPASGGTRMQEGTPAFVAMIGISAAIARHKAAGLPYLVYLRHPTTGGVMSSWASLGHIAVAEPGALLGIVDRIIPEFEDAADEPRAFCERVGHEIQWALATLWNVPAPQRLPARLRRYQP